MGLSILDVFRRAWWPHHVELGRVEGIAGLHDTERYPEAEVLPGLVVYRFDAPLIFANARVFGMALRAIAEERPDLRWLVVAAEPITDVDTTASDMLQELDVWLNERGVSLIFAEMKDPVREKIERYKLTVRSTPRTSSELSMKPSPSTCGKRVPPGGVPGRRRDHDARRRQAQPVAPGCGGGCPT